MVTCGTGTWTELILWSLEIKTISDHFSLFFDLKQISFGSGRLTEDLLWENKLSDFHNRFNKVTQNRSRLHLFFLLFYLVCNQIWLWLNLSWMIQPFCYITKWGGGEKKHYNLIWIFINHDLCFKNEGLKWESTKIQVFFIYWRLPSGI